MRARGGWTKSTLAMLEKVRDVIEELRDFWPLTLRQIYYQLVGAGIIPNNRAAYSALSRLLTKARLDELVPWGAMEDRSRAMLNSGGWQDREAFIESELEILLKGYRRDLLQTQAVVPEVWIEKDALSRVCHQAAKPYCVPVVVARGFSSVSYLNEARERIHENHENGQRTVILYFGDLDPSGWAMLPAMMETLAQEMGCDGMVEARRCALTPAQVEAYSLPKNPDALKETDSRAKKYREEFGDLAVELDALPPAILTELVDTAIRAELDLSLFEEEQHHQHKDQHELEHIRAEIITLAEGLK